MTILIFIYGIIIGSFLNVCIYRIPKEENIAYPSSHCPQCGTSLKCYDNIPLFSYIFLMGKCRYCQAKISLQYPIVEFINGCVYLILYHHFDLSLDFVFYALIFSVLIVVTSVDLKEMIIPDILVIIILILSSIHKFLNYIIYDISPELFNSFLGLLLAGGLFLAIVILSRGGMGGGDVTLIGALGYVLGIRLVMLNILLSFIIGALISIVLLVTRVKSRKDPIPFGPFIVLAFFITVLWGERIIDVYWGLINYV